VGFEPFEVNGVEFNTAQLTNPYIRKAVENLVLLSQDAEDCLLLNRGIDVIEKHISALNDWFANLSPTEQADVLREMNRPAAKNSAT
jgi:hypothetical protein